MNPFILLHPHDTVLVCREATPAGAVIDIDGTPVTLRQSIEVGHKIARLALKTGDKVVKYGAPIGSMIADAHQGEHVHMHNMKSDYIASHTRKVVG